MEQSTMSNLTVTPGTSIPHNPQTHGPFVLLSCASEYHQAMLVPASYIQDTVASVATIEVKKSELHKYFKYTIPEFLHNINIELPDLVLVCMTILTPQQLQLLIRNNQMYFYTLTDTLECLRGWKSLSPGPTSAFSKFRVLSPIINLLYDGRRSFDRLSNKQSAHYRAPKIYNSELLEQLYIESDYDEELGVAIIKHPVFSCLIGNIEELFLLALKNRSFPERYLGCFDEERQEILTFPVTKLTQLGLNSLNSILNTISECLGCTHDTIDLSNVAITGNCITSSCVTLTNSKRNSEIHKPRSLCNDKERRTYYSRSRGLPYYSYKDLQSKDVTLMVYVKDDDKLSDEINTMNNLYEQIKKVNPDAKIHLLNAGEPENLKAYIINGKIKISVVTTNVKFSILTLPEGYITGNGEDRNCFVGLKLIREFIYLKSED